MHKRILIIIIALIAVLSAIGCNQTDETATPKTVKPSNVYKTSFIDTPDGFELLNDTLTENNERIYLVCQKHILTKYGNGGMAYSEIESRLYSCEPDGSNSETLIMEDYPTMLRILSSGNYIGVNFGGSGFGIFASDGAKIKDIYVSDLLGIDKNDDESIRLHSINDIAEDDNGELYLLTRSEVLVLSKDYELLWQMKHENCYELANGGNNKIYLSTGGTYAQYYLLDKENRQLVKQTFTFEEGLDKDEKLLRVAFGDGYDLYYITTNGVYGYNDADGSSEFLLSWHNSDIVQSKTQIVKIISPDTILALIYDDNQNMGTTAKARAAVFTRLTEDEVQPKTEIKLAVTSPHSGIESIVSQFNMTNDKYRVVISDYSIYETPDNINGAFEQLDIDLTTGNSPDIFYIHSNSTDDKKYSSKGVFADLYQLIDSDRDITRDDILYSVRSAFETDGKLYTLPTEFSIDTLVGSKSKVGEKEGMTIDEMIRLYNTLPEDTYLFSNMSRDDFLYITLNTVAADYIDYNNAVCDFYNTNFISYISFVKNYIERDKSGDYEFPSDDIGLISANEVTNIRNGNCYLRKTSLRTPLDFIYQKYFFGDYVIKGYPTANGKGIRINTTYKFAVTEKSAVKDGAMAFIKYCLTNGKSNSYYQSLPSYKPTLEKMFKESVDRYYTIDLSISWLFSSEVDIAVGYDYFKSEGIELYSLDETEVNRILDFFNSTQMEANNDSNIYAILMEEIDLFMNNVIDAETAISYIQDRISTYLSEIS